MAIGVGPPPMPSEEQDDDHKQELPTGSIYEAWDTRGHRRWHEDMRSIGLRVLEQKIAPPQEISNVPQPRRFWNLFQRAYEILRRTSYFRGQDRPTLLARICRRNRGCGRR